MRSFYRAWSCLALVLASCESSQPSSAVVADADAAADVGGSDAKSIDASGARDSVSTDSVVPADSRVPEGDTRSTMDSAGDATGHADVGREAGSFFEDPTKGRVLPSPDPLNATPGVLAADSLGNVFVGAATTSPRDFGLPELRADAKAVALVYALDPSGGLRWASALPNTAIPKDIAVSSSGTVGVVAQHFDTVPDGLGDFFVGPSFELQLLSTAGAVTADVVVTPGLQDDSVIIHGVAVAADGAAYVSGYLSVRKTDGSHEQHFYLSKRDATGAESWTKRIPHHGSAATGRDVTVLANGNVVVTGYFDETLSFGGPELTSRAKDGTFSVASGFVTCFRPDGTHVWSMAFGGEAFSLGSSLATVPTGGFLLGGTVIGASKVGDRDVTGGSDSSAFVAKLDDDGIAEWVRVLSTERTHPVGLAWAAPGDIWVAGSLGAGNDTVLLSATGTDVHSWSNGVDSANSVAAVPTGAWITAGRQSSDSTPSNNLIKLLARP